MTAPYLPQRWFLATPGVAGVAGVLPVFVGEKWMAKKAPVWSTEVYRSRSGRRWTASNWTYPIWRWTLQYEFLRRRPMLDELGKLWAFFNTRQGQAGEFLFLDPDDNAVEDESFGVGDGVTRDFQLTRSLEDWSEPVRALNGSPQILIDGVSTVAVAVGDNATVTFTSAPPDGARLSWTGSYFFRCGFTSDTLEPAQFLRRHWELSRLEFESLK
ncbi:MAG: hypothetical protein E2576_11005 [Alcaligenaceae bacterium]|nr:hypothetical protein [Alcaligenaceae bacterium SAGV5]MPS51264.1 hypothetical protein [Alcaligenaceae bacterium SAGV3]MPT57239.1 hypothetical protein [Alcaligenaceae bacterium]